MTDHLVCISRRGVDPGHRGPELLLIAGELPLGTVKHIILDCLSCPASKARCGLADAMANRVYLNYTKQAMPMQGTDVVTTDLLRLAQAATLAKAAMMDDAQPNAVYSKGTK